MGKGAGKWSTRLVFHGYGGVTWELGVLGRLSLPRCRGRATFHEVTVGEGPYREPGVVLQSELSVRITALKKA